MSEPAPRKRGGTLGVRVTQFAETSFNVRALVCFGINTSNMDAQHIPAQGPAAATAQAEPTRTPM